MYEGVSKSNKTFKKYYQYFLFLFGIFFFFITIIFLSMIFSDVCKLYDGLEKLTVSNYMIFKESLLSLNKSSLYLSERADFRSYSLAQNIQYPHHISRSIKEFIEPYPFVESMKILYLNDSMSILNGNIFCETGIETMEEFKSQMIKDNLIDEYFQFESIDTNIPTLFSNAGNTDESPKIIYCVPMPSPYITLKNAFIFYELDYNYLHNLVFSNDVTDKNYYVIYDQNNKPILEVYDEYPHSKHKPIVNYKDPYIGYSCVCYVNTLSFYKTTFYQCLILIIFDAVSILFAKKISFILAKKLYSPIESFANLAMDTDMRDTDNIFLVLEQFFHKIKTENVKYQGQLISQKKLLESQIFTALLNGNTKDSILDRLKITSQQYMEILGLEKRKHLCIVAVIDNYLSKYIKSKNTSEQWKDKIAIASFFENHVKNGDTLFINDTLQNAGIVIIFSTNEQDDIQDKAVALCNCIKSNMTSIFDFTVTFSIGWQCNYLEDISYSYMDALYFLNYSIFLGLDTVIHTQRIDELLKKNHGCRLNSKDLLDKIILGIKNTDKELMESSIEKLFSRINEQSDIIDVRMVYFDLLTSLRKLLDSITVKTPELFRYQLDLMYTETPIEIQHDLKQFCFRMIEQTSSIRINHGNKKYEEILTYIMENIDDCTLSLETIAEAVSMNPSYLTRFFKNLNGKTLMRYVDDLRFSKSKLYLANTIIPVKEILKQVGYVDENNFSRKFKAREGMTPIQYRNQFK